MVVLILWPVFQDVWRRAFHDDSAPITFHSVILETPVVRVGGVLSYSSVYSKRADCFPPDGKGEVGYRLTRIGDASAEHKHLSYVFDFKREAKWPPGVNITYATRVPIPADIPPGTYTYTAMSTFECKNASRLLTVEGPVLAVTVAQ